MFLLSKLSSTDDQAILLCKAGSFDLNLYM